MTVLMLTGEFYPLIVGGLGLACYELTRALLKSGFEICLALPTPQRVWFHLRGPDDADKLPPVFLDPNGRRSFEAKKITSPSERLAFLGLSRNPEVYYGAASERLSAPVASEAEQPGEYEDFVAEVTNRFRFDVIHAHDWMTFPAAIRAKEMTGVPLICHVHSTEYDRAGGEGSRRIHEIEAVGLTVCDRVIAVSELTSKQLQREYGIPSGKISVVHNACRIVTKKKRGRIFNEPLVVFAGRLTLQKGPGDFIEATRQVMREVPGVRFVITGTGDLERDLMITTAAWRTGTKILFTGFLERKDLEDLLRAADIVAVPSKSEPFGLIVLEAMRLGAAVIVTANAGVAEVIRHAVKIDAGDPAALSRSILDLLVNEKERHRLSLAGMKEASKIHWDDSARRVAEVYKSC